MRSALNRKTLPLDARVKSRTNRNKMIVDGTRGRGGEGRGLGLGPTSVAGASER